MHHKVEELLEEILGELRGRLHAGARSVHDLLDELERQASCEGERELLERFALAGATVFFWVSSTRELASLLRQETAGGAGGPAAA